MKYRERTQRYTITSTPEAIARLDKIAQALKLQGGRSELITKIALGEISIGPQIHVLNMPRILESLCIVSTDAHQEAQTIDVDAD